MTGEDEVWARSLAALAQLEVRSTGLGDRFGSGHVQAASRCAACAQTDGRTVPRHAGPGLNGSRRPNVGPSTKTARSWRPAMDESKRCEAGAEARGALTADGRYVSAESGEARSQRTKQGRLVREGRWRGRLVNLGREGKGFQGSRRGFLGRLPISHHGTEVATKQAPASCGTGQRAALSKELLLRGRTRAQAS